MKLYNTLGRKIDDFRPIQSGHVKFYTCGPTVYDHQTIGNLRTYVLYDTLKRTLGIFGFKVNHVMNITDVGHLTSDADAGEDKLEAGAQKTGKTVWQVAEQYTHEFKDNLRLLNIPEPRLVKATDLINQQIALVEILLDKGFAYQTEQAIYFDTSKLPSYGQLTGQKLNQKVPAARTEVVTDRNKKQPQDFAVWFFRDGHFKDHTMHWPSPWGDGFPGWHLECSAIIHGTLGDPIDIHAGAVDLIGTHHTNEMAQTEAAFGNKLANYWVHGEHLLVDGQRMGKSLDNFYTLKDVVEKGYDPLALRLLYLQAHYRSQLNFTWESLAAAQNNLNNLHAWADLSKQDAGEPVESAKLLKNVLAALSDDLNTAKALALINADTEKQPSEALLRQLDELFGLNLSGRPDISSEQKQLIQQREVARAANDWRQADEIRHKLSDEGIEINDTEHGPIWSRKN